MLQAYIDDAIYNIDKATQKYEIMTQINVMLSGGRDSAVVADLVIRNYENSKYDVKVFSIDTGLSADGWREYIKSLGVFWGKDINIIENQNPDWFAKSVMEHGFPYTPRSHQIVYRWLKERQIAKILRDNKKTHFDRVGFCTGTRRTESIKRRNTPIIDRKGCNVIINPIANWSELHVHEYLQMKGIHPNPFYDTMGGSGDCYCNWGNFTDLETIDKHSPNLYERLKPLHDFCVQEHGYGYNDKPNKEPNLPKEPNDKTDKEFPNLCAGCQRPKPKRDEVLDAFLTDNIDW